MDFLIGTLTRMGGAGIGRVRLENDRLRLLWTNGSLTDPNWQSLGPNGRIFSVSSDMPEPMRTISLCILQESPPFLLIPMAI